MDHPEHTVGGRNAANPSINVCKYPIIYKVSYMSGGYPDFFHQQYYSSSHGSGQWGAGR